MTRLSHILEQLAGSRHSGHNEVNLPTKPGAEGADRPSFY